MYNLLNHTISILIYISIISISILLAVITEKSNDVKKQKLLILLMIIILSLFSGFRGQSVGLDTENYLGHIFHWQSGSISNKYITEPGLYYLSILIGTFVKSPQLVLIVVAFIINTLFVTRIYSFMEEISFSFAIFIYVVSFYTLTLSGIRQWLAIAIVFWGIKYLIDLKYFRFIVFVIFAFLFHNTAVIGLFLIVIDLIINKNNSLTGIKSKRWILLIGIVLAIFSFLLVLNYDIFIRYFNHYLKNITLSGGTGRVLLLKLFIALLIYRIVIKYPKPHSNFTVRFYSYYFIGLLLSIPGYYSKNIGRISLYFSVFEIIIFSAIFKKYEFKKKSCIILLIVIIHTLIFWLDLIKSGRGHVPYLPFWL